MGQREYIYIWKTETLKHTQTLICSNLWIGHSQMHWQLLHIHWKKVTNQVNYQCTVKSGQIVRSIRRWPNTSPTQFGGFFIFIFFKNIFYRNIFSVSHFTVLYPSSRGGRDLHINKYIFFCADQQSWIVGHVLSELEFSELSEQRETELAGGQ